MFTRCMGSSFRLIGSVPDPLDRTARIEVCLVGSHRGHQPTVIFVTKYSGCEVEERSVGLHPDMAEEVAAMLREAVTACRAAIQDGRYQSSVQK